MWRTSQTFNVLIKALTKLSCTAYLKSLLLIHPRREEEGCKVESRDLHSSLKKNN